MTEAIFSLVGVVVGALAGGLATFVDHRRHERREARAAARLIGRELVGAKFAIAEWLDAGSTSDPPRETLKVPAWEMYHAIAARNLASAEWDAVSEAFNSSTPCGRGAILPVA